LLFHDLCKRSSIRTPVKIDLTTGDKLPPGAMLYQYPSGFEEKTLEIWAYNLETVLAEKGKRSCGAVRAIPVPEIFMTSIC